MTMEMMTTMTTAMPSSSIMNGSFTKSTQLKYTPTDTESSSGKTASRWANRKTGNRRKMPMGSASPNTKKTLFNSADTARHPEPVGVTSIQSGK